MRHWYISVQPPPRVSEPCVSDSRSFRFVALIAAVEAFRTMGGQSLYDDLAYIKVELDNVPSPKDASQQCSSKEQFLILFRFWLLEFHGQWVQFWR